MIEQLSNSELRFIAEAVLAAARDREDFQILGAYRIDGKLHSVSVLVRGIGNRMLLVKL